MTQNMVCVGECSMCLEKNVYSALVGVFYKCQLSHFIVFFNVLTDIDINILTDIDTDILNERRVWKYTNVIMDLPVSTFSSITFYFVYFEDLLLDACTFMIV